MYRIALCDDEIDFLKQLEIKIQKYCNKNKINVIIQKFDDSDKLLELVEQHNLFDIYILDIEMPYNSGISLANKIREISSVPIIVFLSAYSKYAVEACGMNIMCYEIKTHLKTKLNQFLDDLFEKASKVVCEKNYIISNQKRYVRINQKDIIYIYKNQKNSVFVLNNNKEEKERITLQNVFDKLDNKEMLFLDRGIIINLNHVKRIVENIIELDNGYMFTTSAQHVVRLKKELNIFWGNMI